MARVVVMGVVRVSRDGPGGNVDFLHDTMFAVFGWA